MGDDSGIVDDIRLQAAGEALKQLIDAYFAISGDVEIDLVTFSSGAGFEGHFTTAASAKQAIDDIVAEGPQNSTDYEAALDMAQARYTPGAASPTHINTVYFLSDGVDRKCTRLNSSH